ncbi:MAG: hypothetical protein M1457_07410, partial [bacterium]|nr:hypothetical protein [bacterium]
MGGRITWVFEGWRRLVALALTGWVWAAAWATAWPGPPPLPRIAARSATPRAEFYDTRSGQRFNPEGNNYIRLTWIDNIAYHTTFNVGLYDGNAAEAALTRMEHDGYNLVRVFIDPSSSALQATGNYGTAGPYEMNTPELYAPWVYNFIDFLRRANRHHVYVTPSFNWVANNRYYATLANAAQIANVEGTNKMFMAPAWIDAKVLYMQKLIEAVTTADGGALLSTIFSWEIQNELSATTTYAPFSLTSGTVTPADGMTYDMADAVSRQACFDNNFNWMLNRIVAGVRAVDPEAMVSSSVFTYHAVGKDGPNGVLPLGTPDKRFPPRPVIMTQSDISFIDIHYYPHPDVTIEDDLATSEFGSLDLTLKPLLMGEFGAFYSPPYYPDPARAAI